MKWRVQTWALIVVLALGVSAAWAQQQKDPRLNPPVAPLPPIMTGESSSKALLDDPIPIPQNAVKPDESPLSGIEAFTLGTKSGARSFVTPMIRFVQVSNNNQRSATSTGDWQTTGMLTGNISLLRAKRGSQLDINYSTGGTLFSTTSGNRGSYHRLGLSEQITFRRWTLMLGDSLTYLPEPSFGGGGFGGISSGMIGGLGNGSIGTGLGGGIGTGLSGGIGTGLGGGIGTGLSGGFGGLGGGFVGGLIPGIAPSQSILTGLGRRLSNTAIGQIQYTISPRASMSASGSYGLLRFLDSGFISSNNYSFRSGYNYALNAADSIGVNYSLNLMRFGGISQSGDFHSISLSYGRRLTGRLALRLSGGPSFGRFANAVTGSSSRTSWNVGSSLLYDFRNTSLGLNYSHGESSGSGVVVGADTDQINGSVSRQLTRMWNGGLMFGFAHNNSIRQLNTVATNRTVNTWHTGFRLMGPLSRQASLSLSYNLAGQRSNNPTGCTGLVCGRLPLQHHFALGITRPLSRKANLSFSYNLSGQSANNPTGCAGLTCGRLPLRHYFALGITWGFGPYAMD